MAIRQPSGAKFSLNGTVSGELRWRKDFAQQWQARYERAQKFVDSEVLRLDERFVPFRQGDLKRSGIRGTVIGSGLVRYIAPYARYQYNERLMVGRAPKRLTDISEAADLAREERILLMLGHFYCERLPDDLNEAARMMAKFLNCGEEGQEEEASQPPLFSFERDGQAIYTAILARYGVDLQEESCHWWKLLTMLGDLGEDCYFSRLLRLRRGYVEGTLSEEEQKELDRLGEAGLPPEVPLDAHARAQLEDFWAQFEEEVSR